MQVRRAALHHQLEQGYHVDRTHKLIQDARIRDGSHIKLNPILGPLFPGQLTGDANHGGLGPQSLLLFAEQQDFKLQTCCNGDGHVRLKRHTLTGEIGRFAAVYLTEFAGLVRHPKADRHFRGDPPVRPMLFAGRPTHQSLPLLLTTPLTCLRRLTSNPAPWLTSFKTLLHGNLPTPPV